MILFLFAKVLNQSAKDRSQSPPPPSLPMSQKDQIICEDLMKLLNWIMILRVHAKCPDSLKHQKCIFACFWAYVGQSHNPIGWATSMPFASINPTKPRTSPWNFGRNCSAFGNVEKLIFFESAILNFFFKKKNLLHSYENKSQIMC